MNYTLDATNQSMGRLATKVATLLRGKHLVSYQPNLEPGTSVTITNLDKVKITGNKLETMKHHHYSGYHGGLYTKTLKMRLDKNPQEVFRTTVLRMLPINRMRAKLMKNLKFS